MKYSVLSDVGRQRANNEDYALAQGDYFIVADGMGGHASGEVASTAAVEGVARFFKSNIDGLLSSDRAKSALENAISYANDLVTARGKTSQQLNGMGTTIVVCYISNNVAHIAHLGDSRCYLLRNGKLKQLTDDHSYVNELVKTGVISEQQAKNHPKRNYITKALGAEGDSTPDYTSVKLLKGDYLLLCTDGLTSMLTDEQIKSILISSQNTDKLVRRLVDAANDMGGSDNITVVLLFMD